MILGERIRLRAVEHSDLEKFVAWLNDPQVSAGLMQIIPMSQTDEERWFESMVKRPLEEHPLAIEVCDADGWKMIGDLGLMDFNWRNRSAEVGIFIGEKQLWNHGYGSEAMTLMLRHAFNSLNLNRVMLRVFETNPRAIRSYEKVGFVLEGRLRQAEYRNGRYLDVLVMSVLRSEWKDEAG
jgi:RimJ/RimL family protein N-acetyltransferase